MFMHKHHKVPRHAGGTDDPETRRKLSESMKGHQHTLGKIYSIESKKRMSEAQKSRRLREKVGTS
jgi:hypothetical protein